MRLGQILMGAGGGLLFEFCNLLALQPIGRGKFMLLQQSAQGIVRAARRGQQAGLAAPWRGQMADVVGELQRERHVSAILSNE